jgi:hypothetical protein
MKKALLVAALFLAASSTSAFADYVAIAISQNAGGAWGKSWGYATQAAAENRALNECRQQLKGRPDDCKIANSAGGGYCIAVATAYFSDGGVAWGSDGGETLDVAHNRAMAQCYTYAKKPCDEVVTDVCSTTAPGSDY